MLFREALYASYIYTPENCSTSDQRHACSRAAPAFCIPLHTCTTRKSARHPHGQCVGIYKQKPTYSQHSCESTCLTCYRPQSAQYSQSRQLSPRDKRSAFPYISSLLEPDFICRPLWSIASK